MGSLLFCCAVCRVSDLHVIASVLCSISLLRIPTSIIRRLLLFLRGLLQKPYNTIPPEMHTVNHFQELVYMCSYSSGIFPNYLFIQLQFLPLGELFSYTGRPFAGARPPFPSAPLSSLVPLCPMLWLFRSKSAVPLSRSLQSLEKAALLGSQHLWVRGEQNPWKRNSMFRAERTKSLEKQHFWVQNEPKFLG